MEIISVNDDNDLYRDELISGGEIMRLNTLLMGLGKPVWGVDRINRRPNGELNLISFRELGANSILEWIHKSPTPSFREFKLTTYRDHHKS
jgi:hypothetical protein